MNPSIIKLLICIQQGGRCKLRYIWYSDPSIQVELNNTFLVFLEIKNIKI